MRKIDRFGIAVVINDNDLNFIPNRMETIEMKALRIKNILNSLEEKIESGNITIREAAIELHKAGWINYIDIDTTKKLLGLN